MRDLLIFVWSLILGILFAWSASLTALCLSLILLGLLVMPLVQIKKNSSRFLLIGLLFGFGLSQHYNALDIPGNISHVNSTFIRRSGLSDFYLYKNRIIEVKDYAGEARYDPPGKKLIYGQPVHLSGTFFKTPFALNGTLFEGQDIMVALMPAPLSWVSRLDQWKSSLSERLIHGLGPETGALASSLVLGTSDPVLKTRAESLRFLGIIHILSISGFHVNLLEMILGKIGFKRVSLPVILGYALLINSVPAWRAALMKLSKGTGRIFGRDSDGTNQLLTAMAILLVGRPYLLFNVSFQLTCAATLGLTALSRPMAEVFLKIPQHFLKDAFLLSLAALIPCLPFLSNMNFDINLALFLANFLIVPLYSLFCMLSFFSLPVAMLEWNRLFFILSVLMESVLKLIGLFEFVLARYFSLRVSYEGFMLILWLILIYGGMKRRGTSVRRQVLVMVLTYSLMFQLTFLPGTTRILFRKERGLARVVVRQNLRQYELVSESMFKSGVRRSVIPVDRPSAAGDLIFLPAAGDFPSISWQGRALEPTSDLSSDIIDEEYLLVLGKRIRLK